MKKSLFIKIIVIIFISSCSNFTEFEQSQSAIPSSRALSGVYILSSSIENNDINVEVGIPLEIEISENISMDYAINNIMLTSNDNFNIPIRIEMNDNILTIFPQIKMQPNSTYILASFNSSITFTTKDLDYGLYWYGLNGYCEKYFPEYNNFYYNDNQPTMVYTHGWQSGSVAKPDFYGRNFFEFELFNWKTDGLEVWTNTGWVNDGWNTGILYWNQFADEDSVYDAEEKIWNLDSSNSRYKTVVNNKVISKNWDRNYSFNNNNYEAQSVIQLLSTQLLYSLKDNISGNIRMIGHSLGNQLATALTHELTKSGKNVDRLALLDPAWSTGSKDYLPSDIYGNWTGERTRNFIFEMVNSQKLNSVEAYHTTPLNWWTIAMDSNDELMDKICNVDLAPWYYSATDIGSKHIAAIHNYIWSYSFAPPIECKISFWSRYKTGNSAPSASTSTNIIKSMMKSDNRWVQVEGRYTFSPGDDWFEVKGR